MARRTGLVVQPAQQRAHWKPAPGATFPTAGHKVLTPNAMAHSPDSYRRYRQDERKVASMVWEQDGGRTATSDPHESRHTTGSQWCGARRRRGGRHRVDLAQSHQKNRRTTDRIFARARDRAGQVWRFFYSHR